MEVADEACVVPSDICPNFEGTLIVSKNHALSCPGKNTWFFCEDTWERQPVQSYSHIQLKNYYMDSLLSQGVVLESWDGYTREENEIKQVCKKGCPWPHKWVKVDKLQWIRKIIVKFRVRKTDRATKNT